MYLWFKNNIMGYIYWKINNKYISHTNVINSFKLNNNEDLLLTSYFCETCKWHNVSDGQFINTYENISEVFECLLTMIIVKLELV